MIWSSATIPKNPEQPKYFRLLQKFARPFNLSEPIWLDINIRDFKRHSKTRFTQDNFIDSIDFDYLEIQVIEEIKMLERSKMGFKGHLC